MKDKKHKRRKWSPMRLKLVKELAKGKTIAQAGIDAGYKNAQSAYTSFHRINTRGMMTQALTDAGYDPTAWIKKSLIPKLNAKKTLYFNNSGIVTDKREVIDWNTRIAADEMYLRIQGIAQQVEHSGQVEHVLTQKEKQEAVECLKRIEAFAGDSENAIEAEVEE